MDDIRILENLFNNKHDGITFQNLEESNIISLNNNNKGDYSIINYYSIHYKFLKK